ncbi:MAG TPA: TetR/AcrR family transcriptional regulator [Pseudonocardia sp.]|jgi:AcrR family transcriptional regulator|nr:TetR/AcrR family transcriptional regulator [Pseudonocardia sp.]
MTDSQRTHPGRVPGALHESKQSPIPILTPTSDAGEGGAMGRRRRAAQSAGGEEYHAKRLEVIHAAAIVFAAKGYHATHLDDIATALNTNRATLYYYVSSKEELLREAVAECAPGLIEQARSIAAGPGTASNKLRAFIGWIMAAYEADYPHRYLFLLRNDGPRDGPNWVPQIDQVGRELQARLVDILTQGIDNGELRSDEPLDLMANAIFGMLNWTNRWFTPECRYPAGKVADSFAEIVLGGLAQQHPQARRG